MRKFAGFVLGVLAGAVVGGVAGLLLAPYTGPEMQERLCSRFEDLVEEGKHAAAARRAELQAELEAFKRGGESSPSEMA